MSHKKIDEVISQAERWAADRQETRASAQGTLAELIQETECRIREVGSRLAAALRRQFRETDSVDFVIEPWQDGAPAKGEGIAEAAAQYAVVPNKTSTAATQRDLIQLFIRRAPEAVIEISFREQSGRAHYAVLKVVASLTFLGSARVIELTEVPFAFPPSEDTTAVVERYRPWLDQALTAGIQTWLAGPAPNGA